MMLSTAIALLLTAPAPYNALNINPHRRYNDVIINTALSSTAFDQRAPPVSVSENYNDRGLDVDFITSALLEPPIPEERHAENNFYADNWNGGENGDWYDDQYEREQQFRQHQQQFRRNSRPARNMKPQPEQRVPISRQIHSQQSYNTVMTGSERRATWESYARPGISGRHINSNMGGVIGAPNGIGDWEYSSMYGPATSVNSLDRQPRDYDAESYSSGRAPNMERRDMSASRLPYNMGNAIGFGEQRPSNRETSYHVGGAVMTGAQRRAGFQNIHSFEPYVPGVKYHLPDAADTVYDRFASDVEADRTYTNGARSNNVGFDSFQPQAPSLEIESDVPDQVFDMDNEMQQRTLELHDEDEVNKNDFKPFAPALEVQDQHESRISSPYDGATNLQTATSANTISSSKGVPSFKGSENTYSPNNGVQGFGGGMFKGPGGLGLKGKEQSKGTFKSVPKFPGAGAFSKAGGTPTFKKVETSSQPFKGMKKVATSNNAPSFKAGIVSPVKDVGGSSLPLKGLKTDGIEMKRAEPSKRALSKGISFPGAGLFGKSSGPQPASKIDDPADIFLPSNGSKGLKMGPGSVGMKGNKSREGVVGKGMKFPGAGLFGKSTGASKFQGADAQTIAKINGAGKGLGNGILKEPSGLGLKSKDARNSIESSEGLFGKSSYSSPIKGGSAFGGTMKLKHAPGSGIFGKTSNSAPLKGSGPPLNDVFGKKSSQFASKGSFPSKGGISGAAFFAKKSVTSSTSNSSKPFVPTSNRAPEEQQEVNSSLESEKSKSFMDFVSGQGRTNNQDGFKHPLPDSQTEMQRNAAAPGPGQINGFKSATVPIENQMQADNTGNFVGSSSTSPNKFKPFVPSIKAQQQVEDEQTQPQDLASFLQNPSKGKQNAKEVAASLSSLSSPPIFYNDFDSPDDDEESMAYRQDSNNLNFAISNGAVQEMPSVSEVPMNTPARQSLPPYLSLHPIPGKGLGVITNKSFKIGEFIGNYEGEIMSEEVKDRRYLKSLEHKLTEEDRQWIQNRLERGQTITGTYLYGVDLDAGNVYKHFGRSKEEAEEAAPDRIFVDAEDEYESLWTRFINHASPPLDNLKPMSVPESYDGKPRVWFMAKRDIEPGEELCFDYGEDYWLEGDEVF